MYMYSDVSERKPYFEAVQETAIEALRQSRTQRTVRDMNLRPVLTALEEASAVGLNEAGLIVKSASQSQSKAPLVLCGYPGEQAVAVNSPQALRSGDPADLPGKHRGQRPDSETAYHQNVFKTPSTVTTFVQRRFTLTHSPRVIAYPSPDTDVTGAVLAHEIVHWVDAAGTRLRFAPARSHPTEKLLLFARTEKRAYSVSAAILSLHGIDVALVSKRLLAAVPDRTDLEALSKTCQDLAYDSAGDILGPSVYDATLALTVMRMHARDNLQEAQALRQLKLIHA
jgi:hypothetical protein